MPTVSIRSLVLAAGTTAAVALLACVPATAHATPDLPVAVEACTVATAALGRDPPSSVYMRKVCGVWSPDDFATAPSWGRIELLATDPLTQGSGVIVRLWCTSRSTGTRTIAGTVSSQHATAPSSFSAKLPAPLAFSRCAYHLEIDSSAASNGSKAVAHVVALRP